LGLVAIDGHASGVAIDCDGDLLAGVARVGEGKLGLQFVAATTGDAAGLEGNQIFTWNAAAAPDNPLRHLGEGFFRDHKQPGSAKQRAK
jgi:hypothetical protein